MAYREVRRMDIDQVIRRWLAGEKIRAMARSTGMDRSTVRRIVRCVEEAAWVVVVPAPAICAGFLRIPMKVIGVPG